MENQRLVFYVYHKLKKSEQGVSYKDELIGNGFVALSKAALLYDVSRGRQFSSFAIPCIRNGMYVTLKELNKVPTDMVSFSKPLGNDEKGSRTCVGDIVPGAKDYEEQVVMRAYWEKKFAELPGRESKMLRLKCAGYKISTIAEMFHLSEPTVCVTLRKARNKLRNEIL